ncbi:putative inorganic phosphate cotransporter isoform X3 [Diabrotica virgifera virgifera]|uniref:Major facilitator superfamily (MFS) profile domain-containing protein n=1 Tax=Diabrotica virgifera virgifera TaxID=50390 RepID=A0ABM5KE35_DIAVI|nr:putative inorganic phosphate cotransporter isoform X2 [Diabrotica virgifera virgifera]XP_050508461.1 putative inorganic phosphate cotransporter isoform X3 [Diabrotica virgifera virgifera]
MKYIQQRYVLGFMGFLASVIAYTLRVCLNIAITKMVLYRENAHIDPDACPDEDSNHQILTEEVPTNLYHWDETTKGIILSSFFWGYAVSHIPGGLLAQKFGGKNSLGLSILCSSVLTLMTPWVIVTTNGNWIILVVWRSIIGLAQGVMHPALNNLLSKWIPLSERAKIGTLVFAGGQIGTISSNLISGTLINATGTWTSVFYVFGAAGIIWHIFWQIFCYSDPVSHPFITKEEFSYLKSELESISVESHSIPWRSIFTSVPVWALVIAQIGHDWGFYTMITDLPSYMSDVLKFNVKDNGIWNSVPYLVMWLCSMGSGWLCDWLISSKRMTVTKARKFFTTIASLGPGIFIMAASYSGCHRYFTVTMFTMAMGFLGAYYSSKKVNALDLAPNYAGILMALVNGIGAITGIIAPYLAGTLTENHTLKEWRTIFWITFFIFLITNIIFCIFGSGEEQVWNNFDNKNVKEIHSTGEDTAFFNFKRKEKNTNV